MAFGVSVDRTIKPKLKRGPSGRLAGLAERLRQMLAKLRRGRQLTAVEAVGQSQLFWLIENRATRQLTLSFPKRREDAERLAVLGPWQRYVGAEVSRRGDRFDPEGFERLGDLAVALKRERRDVAGPVNLAGAELLSQLRQDLLWLASTDAEPATERL